MRKVIAESNPEVGRNINAGGYTTNYHDIGTGFPTLMLHGSGPGVSAWANWRAVIPALSAGRRIVAPDLLGFGYSERPSGVRYNLDNWVQHAVGLLDALELQQVDLIGNSFGGALSLALAVRHPGRVRRLVLMGSAGVPFAITTALDAVWGYTPSLENMRSMMDIFAHDRGLVTDELARMRYEASLQPGLQEAYSSMFPTPRQNAVDELCSPEAALRALPHQTLIIHGREDRVIPPANAAKLSEWIPNSQMHIFGKCGHWTQIEHAGRFSRLVAGFLDHE
ncbi:alpha/beta fold hydrolase [Nevskia ramosa]|uniref:alpha/beta fold hydrolase n=1 Tax=Nevskia ramosa TaxID=64002 RepID=UPI003D11CC3F